ncbi:MAG: HAMP domain-containing histidine kinase [Ruminococcaceae bacterium]|nr:HAMP domain-containing histidine kinase [Oscillospiraceae bacterium]
MTGRERGNRIGIQWKMYAILILFIVLIVGVLWFFQAQMMNYFYQMAKFTELELSAAAITTELDDREMLEEVMADHASEYYQDIWVYHITKDGDADLVADAKGTGELTIPFMTRKFSVFYDKAVANEGLYIAMVPMEQFHEDLELHIVQDNSGEPSAYPFFRGNSGRVCAVYVKIHQINGEQYMMIQSTELTPIRAMVSALKDLALWVGFILSVVALFIAWLMSRLITKPIVKMNEAAKSLAQGRYDANFYGKGYREINELADTLNYASRELAKTDRLQKELISNISHDLRTPLTMIKGYGEVMRDIPGENTSENIQIIIDETSRLSQLVNDMLDLSRIQAGTRKPEYSLFSLTETVRETLTRYERLVMQDGYRIEFIADADARVLADRGMILQVVYNLINNAVNYTGEDRFVSVRQELSSDRVRISITDTGEGIAEDQLAMIWERYYKVDKVHKRAAVGTGLGLSIVKGILELHHAAYGVQSRVGHGSVFWFELPTANADPEYLEADYEAEPNEPPSERDKTEKG